MRVRIKLQDSYYTTFSLYGKGRNFDQAVDQALTKAHKLTREELTIISIKPEK